MLQGSGEDVVHLVLECLAAVIRADPQGAQAWEGHISPCVLQLWVHHIADPLLAMEAGAVLQALAAGPAAPTLQVGPAPPATLRPPAPSFDACSRDMPLSFPTLHPASVCLPCIHTDTEFCPGG